MDNFYNESSKDLQLKRLKDPFINQPLTFEDPNNAPPTEAESMGSSNRRHSLLFDSLPVTVSPKVVGRMRNRTETFSHSSRPFVLQDDDVPLAHTSSNPVASQRRTTISGIDLGMNRKLNLSDQNTGAGSILDAFGPGLFTGGWDNFTSTNQSPLSGLMPPEASNYSRPSPISAVGLMPPEVSISRPSPISAVDTVVSAIDFLDIGGPTSFKLVEDPFSSLSSPAQSLAVPASSGTQFRMRSYSSAFENPIKPAAPIRHRSISIPEKEMRLELDAIQPFLPETINFANQRSPAPESESTPTRSLWVGHLDSNISRDELVAIFESYGPIESIRMIPERECAFINFLNVEDATKAKTALNGGHIGSCIIKIAYGKVDISAESIANNASKSLWIGNIPATLEPVDLENIFSRFGSIESARVLSHKNCGFINFVRLEDAAEAKKQMNGKEISGATVKIGFAKVPNSNSVTPTVSVLPETDNESNTYSANVNTNPTSAWPRLLATSNAVNHASGSSAYSFTVPSLPQSDNRLDNNILRDFRKRLENSNTSLDQVAEIFNSVISDAATVAADYIGNVVIQKLIEKGTDDQRFQIIHMIAPYIATIGIHKNGTWAIQKILDTAQNPQHIEKIVQALTPYTPALLLDQYGNYVVQCCLRFGSNQNQFIFEAISCNTLKIGLARFGARATRTCLESQFTSKAQQQLVASSIIKYCYELSCDQNGALLMSWLVDSYSGAGKYAELVSVLKQNLLSACTHKIASAFVLKLCAQKSELDAKDAILDGIFSKNLIPILADPVNGTSLIRKILTSCLSDQSRLLSQISKLVSKSDIQRHASIKRFMEEFSITMTNDNISR